MPRLVDGIISAKPDRQGLRWIRVKTHFGDLGDLLFDRLHRYLLKCKPGDHHCSHIFV